MSVTIERSEPRTAAALAARRRNTQAALDRIHDAITRLRREKTPVSVAAVARRAAVSRTFLYTNPDAKTAIAQAVTQEPQRDNRPASPSDERQEPTWRERALNAEDALEAANAEILNQRSRLGELLGRIRDLESHWTPGHDPARHDREHHIQAAPAAAHQRQPHPRRTTPSLPIQPAVPRPPHRRPRNTTGPTGTRGRRQPSTFDTDRTTRRIPIANKGSS
jgi:hypothetical protein